MIIAGYEFKGEKPFENVYLTGLVRDKQRRKMSKSLGNSPDALALIDTYGADGVRVGLLLSSAAGNDLLFDEELCKQGKSFANKIWNAFRLIHGWEVADIAQPSSSKIALEWYESRFNSVLKEVEDHYSKYRLSDALMSMYKLIWDDFCSWLLELVKPGYQEPIDKTTSKAVISLLEANLKILHPFMPFLTEEIWQLLKTRSAEEALMISRYPELGDINEDLINEFEIIKEVISNIRTLRKEKNISFKQSLELSYINKLDLNNRYNSVIEKMGHLSSMTVIQEPLEGALTFRVKSNEYFIPVGGAVDLDEELKKLTQELEYTEGFLKSVQKKLCNERFVNNAPETVVNSERKKESDALAKINTLRTSIEALSTKN
jgi:valyl-tRNA synthetase